ncbi:phosphoglucosamine mutase [Halobellus ruber]|uniref:Phosphoglucosamine mutase n=1 Tax=Halobellus ruber TaxID=2761102 RepID=A0A7J9SKA5_9EURY|nr:phosphoglucosamine mutase [Halobellus ruber]MBB6647390.1 phosphoglucosamine mutase [Halobellus ruber]
MQLFGSSGTRGVVGEGLSPEFVLRIAKAAGTAWSADSVFIARDTRTSGEMLANAAASGLASVGVDVDRLGTAPTPAAVRYADVYGRPGLVITASHNPPEYNGVKLVGADGVELGVDRLERIEERILSEEFSIATWDAVGTVSRVDSANREYVADLLAAVDREAIAAADLTVALDPGHGAGALTSPDFFRRLGCEVVTVNATPDGFFPGRQPEPVASRLDDLRTLVTAADADVGIAHDGDADRAVFVDEAGEFVAGEASLAALAAAELDTGDTTVAAVNVSQRLVDVCERVGADLELTPIGSTNIISRIRELRADGKRVPIAGEGNGGVFFPNYRLVRDGAYAGAKLLELVAERPVSELVAPYTDYENVRLDLAYETDAELDAMLDAARAFAASAAADPDTKDGYRLDYGDAWVLVRPSGTEPKVRIYAEARDADRARSLAEEIAEPIRAALENARAE